ncbi:GNAT family N-acetyltransferase [Roseimarinus sediminis]|jgi:GNAT superfamily N-acetyltransferase|uniref:GNAT family N-acetyltransferase n=1 Tax=Roseimarinus sediminis TaxID=1610899 RepID=UPI003D1ADCBD
MGIRIRRIEISELNLLLKVLNHLPELDASFDEAVLLRRLNQPGAILLLAEFAGKPIGCKLAYNRYFDGSVYSWLGGVLPPYRNMGVASALLDELVVQAERMFFNAIRMKTRNRHVGMLRFALKRNFTIIGFVEREPASESRIELIRHL